MKKSQQFMKQTGAWIVIILQMIVGSLVIKTGVDLAAGKVLGSVSISSDPITPLFIILLGIYFCFSGLFRKLFNNRPPPNPLS